MYIFNKEMLIEVIRKVYDDDTVFLLHNSWIHGEHYDANRKHPKDRVHYEFSFNPNPTIHKALPPVTVLALMVGKRSDFRSDVLQVLDADLAKMKAQSVRA